LNLFRYFAYHYYKLRKKILKIQNEYQPDHQAKLTVEFEPELLEEYKRRGARKIASKVKIPGFRPGKAPYNVIVRNVGESSVVEEAVDLLIESTYPKIIEESGINPYGPGSLKNIVSMEPPVFEFIVPLEAEVTLPYYHGIRLPYERQPVTDDDVQAALEEMRDSRTTYETIDRPAEDGDQVKVLLSADRKDVEEGQSIQLIRERSVELTINAENENTIREWPFDGFSRHLVGLSVGNEKIFEYTYPEDAHLESLRGTSAIYRFKVEEIKLPKLPELDDDFAKSVGEFESIELLRSQVRLSLDERAKSEYDNKYNDLIISSILENTQIKYPPQMLEHEIDNYYRQLENRLSGQGLDMTTYLKTRQLDETGLREEIKPNAETRLKRSLLLYEISQAEDIKVEEAELELQAQQTYANMAQYATKEDMKRMSSKDFIQSMVATISSDILVQKTLERLQSISKGELATDQVPPLEEEADDEAEEAQPTTLVEGNEQPESIVVEEPLQATVDEPSLEKQEDKPAPKPRKRKASN
jgi:trigger factor